MIGVSDLEIIEKGALYLVSTPIGNLSDFSYRAVHILKNVNLIAAEDTRTSRVLLNHYEIATRITSYHSFNLKKETPRLLHMLAGGQSIALISDAGTPGISDPGYQLVQVCVDNAVRVIPVPGASALLAGLVASGLPTHRFVYEGFLPQKKGRKTRLTFLADESRTMVIYESPHRIEKTVRELHEFWGERQCVMAREITKKFEEFYRGTLLGLAEHLQQKKIKGEIVLIVAGKENHKKTRSSSES